MRRSRLVRAVVLPVMLLLVLSACATMGPPGPSSPAYMGAGKTPVQFADDDVRCRSLATALAGDPGQVHQQQAASAVGGALVGAAFGALIGVASGNPGLGAAIGGGAGVVGGLGVGTAQAQHDAARIQQRWNSEYYSCMNVAGHIVPGMAPASMRGAPPPPPPPAPPAAVSPFAVPCTPTGRLVRTAQGLVPECL